MPEVANVGDLYQVRIVGRQEGQETNNVLNFACVGADPDVLTHLILVLMNCFITHLLPVLSSAWSLEKVVWKRTGPTLGPEITSIPVGAGAGGGSAVALPSYCSLVLSMRTAQGGPRKRGRIYIAGIPESATTNSLFNTADPFWAAALAFALCVITDFVPGHPPGAPAWALGVYSRLNGSANFPYTGPGFEAMTSLTPVQIVATTRSRKLGRGA